MLHGKNLQPLTGAVFVNSLQVIDSLQENSFTYGESASASFNLRYPGQYRDSETGLFYNGMRTYAPQLGAYTQMDPIGLGGGLDRRGYVGGNPFSATDPTGEFLFTTGAAWPNFIPGFFRPNPWLPIPAPPPYNPITDTFTPQPAVPNFVLPPFPIVVPIVTIINSIIETCRGVIENSCQKIWDKEHSECQKWSGFGSRWVKACETRANDRLSLCHGNGGSMPPDAPEVWSPDRRKRWK